jgi:hypothetical protein
MQLVIQQQQHVQRPMVWPCCGGVNSSAYVVNCYQFGIGLFSAEALGSDTQKLYEDGPSPADILANDCSCTPSRHEGSVAWPVLFEVRSARSCVHV